MTGIAEFKIIGRVGAIKDVGTTVRVSIAANYSYKDNRGEWIENVKWNEVTIFNEATQGFVKRNLTKGDLVYTDGRFCRKLFLAETWGYDRWKRVWRNSTMIEFKGSHFEREVILWGVRWYVAYPISYR